MSSSNNDGVDEIYIKVKVIPRAKQSKISGFMADGSLKVRVAAPPVDGKANRELIKLLADCLDIQAAHITLVSGQQGRKKVVKIIGLISQDFEKKISQYVS
jgi:uncharacterized protein (TIGR00251 family)